MSDLYMPHVAQGLRDRIAELETEVARMNKTQCPYCGSVGTCHDSCVGVDMEPLNARIAELEAENERLLAIIGDCMFCHEENRTQINLGTSEEGE